MRDYWAIEAKQHYRRDHTQREDHCLVRDTNAARSLAIFLFEQQGHRPRPKKSLPDWQKRNHRDPNPLLRLLTS